MFSGKCSGVVRGMAVGVKSVSEYWDSITLGGGKFSGSGLSRTQNNGLRNGLLFFWIVFGEKAVI